MRTLPKVVIFSEIETFVYNLIKKIIPGMITSILPYVPPSAEFLGPRAPPVFKPEPTTPRLSNQIDGSI